MNKPWICPKCGRVYGPSRPECGACNLKITDNELTAPNPLILIHNDLFNLWERASALQGKETNYAYGKFEQAIMDAMKFCKKLQEIKDDCV
jgi:hypothetical protein